MLSRQLPFLPFFPYLLLSAPTFALPTSSAKHIRDINALIPPDFTSTLEPIPGTNLPIDETHDLATSLFAAYATQHYNKTISSAQVGNGNITIIASPILGKESLFLTKHALHGLYACTKALSATNPPAGDASGTFKPAICHLAIPSGVSVGSIVFAPRSPETTLMVPSSDGLLPNSPPNVGNSPTDTALPPFRPVIQTVLGGTSIPLPNSNSTVELAPTASEAGLALPTNEEIYTQISPPRGGGMNESVIFLGILETGLDLAAQDKGPEDRVDENFSYEHQSREQRVRVQVQTKQNEKDPPRWSQVIRGVMGLQAAFARAGRVVGQTEFSVFVQQDREEGRAVLDGTVMPLRG